jgi:hypothetical protein
MYNDTQLANALRGTLAERLLVAVSDQRGFAEHDQLLMLADGDAFATSDATQVLVGSDLARSESMSAELTLTESGLRVAQRIRALRSGQWRFEDLQRAALTWLNGQGEGAVPDLDGFLDAPDAADFEPPVTMREFRDVIELLGVAEYVKPITVAELGPVRAMITPKGRVALRSGLPLSEFGDSRPTTHDQSHHVTFGDGAQVGPFQSGGQGNVQIVEQVISPAARSELAAQVASLIKMAEELPDDTPGLDEGREDLDLINKELAKPGAKPAMLKSLAYKALGTFAVAAATSGGQQMVQGLGHLLKLLEQAAN